MLGTTEPAYISVMQEKFCIRKWLRVKGNLLPSEEESEQENTLTVLFISVPKAKEPNLFLTKLKAIPLTPAPHSKSQHTLWNEKPAHVWLGCGGKAELSCPLLLLTAPRFAGQLCNEVSTV